MLARGPTARIEALQGDTFRFACGPGLRCFGDCCSDLTLLLLPYDLLRLRRRLGMGSAEAMERLTETLRDGDTMVPRVHLKMGPDPARRYPFLSEDGCEVYEDRPSACRMFPLGRAASVASDLEAAFAEGGKLRVTHGGVREQFFLVKEKVCRGFDGGAPRQTVEGWLDDQGLRSYLAANDRWLPVFTRLPALTKDPHAEQRFSMFRTAAYDLDRFRDLVTGEAFTSRFELDEALLARLGADDEELLAFAVRWLSFALFGDQTMRIRA